ncbi:MAG TPA: hypothetical protein VES19_04055 [Candidatus Limnocylindrales bacterium]|nr:hypothetical protein [Candidatus Limnocylindrales bacterium]
MIVEPTPTNPRSPWRRALRMGGLVLPVALLAAVMAAGFLGPKPETEPPRVAVATPAPAVPSDNPSAGAVPTASRPASPAPAELAAVEPPEPPTQFGDLATTTPGALAAARAGGPVPATLAVSGFLKVDPGEGCADQPGGDALGPWCARTGILADWWWTSMSTLTGPVPPHLHVTVPIGVRVPTPVALAAASSSGGGTHVLVVGRFADAAECGGASPAPRDCDDVFIVERFAWVDGVRVGLSPLIADRLDTGGRRPNPFALVLDAADMPLSAVLVWPDAVPAIDPAAAALAAAGPRSEPVWYLRVLDGDRGPGMERTVRWMLLAEKDLRVLGSGRPDGTTTAAGDGPAAG